MAGATTKNVVYKSLRPSQILGSEKMVTCVIEVLSEEYLNPFSVSLDENLCNLSSGVPVEDELANKISCTEQKGSAIYRCFANEKLLAGGTENFHDPLPRNKVYSFKNTSKKILIKKNNRERTVEVNLNVLGLLVRLSLCRGQPVDVKNALRYPLSPIPLSIATPDGERHEATKSKLMDVILKKTRNPPKPAKSVIAMKKQKPPALVVDLIAVMRTMTELPQTYYKFTWKFLGSLPKGYKHVDLVADTYREISIKNGERQKRGASARLMIYSPQSKSPREFNNFLRNGENKTRLIELIFQVISQELSRALQMLKCDKIYCSKESHTVAIDSNGVSDIDDLKSNQEESDTKVILHCLDTLKEPQTAVVLRSHSGDTNIMILTVALIRSDCERLYIDYGNGKNRKDICLAVIIMNENEKDALLGFHAFSGNDYIPEFFRKGKSSGWKCMVKTETFVQLFADFIKSWELEESNLLLLKKFLYNLYGYKCRNINLIW